MRILLRFSFVLPLLFQGHIAFAQKIDRKEIEAMGKEAQTLFWQNWNP